MIFALAFLAGILVGICGVLAVSLTLFSSRLSRAEERWGPLDDQRPEERHE